MNIQNKIPANKFYPPSLDGSMCLFRKRLVTNILASNNSLRRVIIITAQAGQGKTTLAQQFLEHTQAKYAWYLIGQEDHDPVLMFATLLECLLKAVPQFRPESVLAIVNEGDLSVLNLFQVVNMLLAELNAVLLEDFYLVFDDLHLLDGSPAVSLLEYLLAAPSTRLKFLLLGRHALPIKTECLQPDAAVLELGKGDIALSVIETMALFNQEMGLDLPWKKVAEIHALTEGWIMGLVMIASALQEDVAKIKDLKGLTVRSGLASYLKNEVFAHLPVDLTVNLIKLSLLDEIEIPLAIEITGDADICDHLNAAPQCNNFLRGLESEMQVFRLHHLWRDFLREKAVASLGGKERAAVLKAAAQYYLAKDLLESALVYYSKAEAYQDLETVLELRGMRLVSMNRGLTLLSLLDSVPLDKRSELAWLNLLAGIVSLQIMPANCLPLLQQALLLFQKDGNHRGELLAISQLVYLHWVATGAFNYGADLLPRAEELYGELAATLDVYDRILVCSNISCGFSAFIGDMDKANYYSTEAMNLAVQHGMRNFMADIVFIQGFRSYFCDQFLMVYQDIEKAQKLLVDPHVGLFNRTALMALQVDVLGLNGDFENYFRQEGVLIEPVGQERIGQTVLGAFMPIWRATLAIARGHFQDALEEVMLGHASGVSAQNPHLRSVLLQWQAYAFALLDKNEEALPVAEESLALRKATGGPFFEVCNNLIVGMAFLRMGLVERAAQLLSQAVDGAAQLGNSYIIAAASMQIAYMKRNGDLVKDSCDELRQGLEALKEKKRTYCWGLTPIILQELISRAVKLNIETAWARKIAAERLSMAVLNTGELIPLLQIKILGSFSIGINDEIVCQTEDLPPAQRQMLAIIIAAPDHKISQEKVQLLFWPESPPDKARSKLDVLLLRLRKSLSTKIRPLDLKKYLSLKKGIICLEHCEIDAVTFVEKATAALQYAKRQQSWQAGNYFYPAMQLWRGCFASDIFSQDQVQEYCYEMRMLFVKASMKWGEILAEMGRAAEAAEVMERAFVYEPGNAQLVKMLYGLLMTVGNAPKAQQVVDRYENILYLDDYGAEEVAEMVQQIVVSDVLYVSGETQIPAATAPLA